MSVVVDTSVWSLVLRRTTPTLAPAQEAARRALAALLEDDLVTMLGPIRQELLSGVRSAAQFDKLRERLAAWSDEPLSTADHVRAAELFNQCRRDGIAATGIDLLIAAVCERLGAQLLTLDGDFDHIAGVSELRLLAPPTG